jgi:hypothetical protein
MIFQVFIPKFPNDSSFLLFYLNFLIYLNNLYPNNAICYSHYQDINHFLNHLLHLSQIPFLIYFFDHVLSYFPLKIRNFAHF